MELLTEFVQIGWFQRAVVNRIANEKHHIIIIAIIILVFVTIDLYFSGRVIARYRSADIVHIVTLKDYIFCRNISNFVVTTHYYSMLFLSRYSTRLSGCCCYGFEFHIGFQALGFGSHHWVLMQIKIAMVTFYFYKKISIIKFPVL